MAYWGCNTCPGFKVGDYCGFEIEHINNGTDQKLIKAVNKCSEHKGLSDEDAHALTLKQNMVRTKFYDSLAKKDPSLLKQLDTGGYTFDDSKFDYQMLADGTVNVFSGGKKYSANSLEAINVD